VRLAAPFLFSFISLSLHSLPFRFHIPTLRYPSIPSPSSPTPSPTPSPTHSSRSPFATNFLSIAQRLPSYDFFPALSPVVAIGTSVPFLCPWELLPAWMRRTSVDVKGGSGGMKGEVGAGVRVEGLEWG